MEDRPLRVGVIGASGIGKQHAKWFDRGGCEVVAFAGTSPASVAATTRVLEDLFGFSGVGHVGHRAMLDDTDLDIVVVASPHQCHREHAVDALEAGAHVYCEKPLVWDANKSADEVLADGAAVVDCARRNGRLIGVNVQYMVGVHEYGRLYSELRGAMDPIVECHVTIESKGGGGRKEYEEIPTDLGSHPLSMLQAWSPDVAIDENSIACRIGRKETVAEFRCHGANLRDARVQFVMGNIAEGTPRRRFGVNGLLVDCSGRNDEDGVYRTIFTIDDREVVLQDMMEVSIERFLAAVAGRGEPVADGATGLRNVELHRLLMDRATQV